MILEFYNETNCLRLFNCIAKEEINKLINRKKNGLEMENWLHLKVIFKFKPH